MQNIINYSTYSIGFGILKPEDIIDNALENGNKSVFITDMETLSGVSSLYSLAKEKNIKTIIGTTINVQFKDQYKGNIVLYAKNQEGYSKLCKILSNLNQYNNYEERVYPLIDLIKEIRGNENIILGDGFENSLLENFLINNDLETYKKIIPYLKNNLIFIVNDKSLYVNEIENLSKQSNGINIISSNISRYKDFNDKFVFLSKLNKTSYYRDLSSEEIIKKFKNDYSIKNITKLNKDNYLNIKEFENLFENYNIFQNPSFPVLYKDKDLTETIRRLWSDFSKNIPEQEHKRYIERIKYELKVIKSIGLNIDQYFLFYEDISHVAKKNDIITSIRGSGTGSLLLHIMGLSDVDPVEMNLSFERFLNPDRASLADIDLEVSKKEIMDDYIKERFGNNVAKLMQFDTIQKATTSMEMIINGYKKFKSESEIDNEKEKIEWVEKKLKDLSEFLVYRKKEETKISYLLENDKFWQSACRQSSLFKKIAEYAVKLEDQISNRKPSSSSFVLSSEDLRERVPVIGNVIESEKNDSDDYGFVKNDLLSSKILENQRLILDLLSESKVDIILEMKKRNDPLIFKNLSNGLTAGINQINGIIGIEICKEIKPTNFQDIIAILALVREGIKNKTGEYETFLKAKENPSLIHYPVKEMEPILKSTYGAIIYEEQIMDIAREIGGFNWNEADQLRSCLKNKKLEKLNELKILFYKGASKKGYSIKEIDSVFNRIHDKINQFSFSRNHSTAYASITYNEMYLKTYYPAEFMQVYAPVKKDKKQKFKDSIIKEILINGIGVIRPDINEVQKNTYTSTKVVRSKEYKLIIQSLSSAFSNQVMYENVLLLREKYGFFNNISDYTNRVLPLYTGKSNITAFNNQNSIDLFKKDTLNLINIGAFDNLYEKILKTKDIVIIRETLKNNLNNVIENIILNDNVLSDNFYLNTFNYKEDSELYISKFIEEEKKFLDISPISIINEREKVKQETTIKKSRKP